ncbi:ThiF family adenylyltransferase [Sedimentimonas flavescens]|uniref:ThiF family adenylyltransferase n=1 Tax=Sedimentimonas flavescens TaxID=2851012 RepID=A0ABT2ZXH2_9RHOB|nr:ThiF family adenylyltransferase [Sedimentimonas flavescens]MCV2878452.1 ThiF family adenylyltransferase [Sedimentimonas flavescens]
MSRYLRQTALPEIGPEGQARLARAHVAVIGAGGLGCGVIPALAGAGVGQLTILDPDQVEESNLHRQTLYRMTDIGQPKALCAAREVVALNPGIRAEGQVMRLLPSNMATVLEGAELIIDAADSFAVSYMLSDYCHPRGIPLVSAAVLARQGYVGAFCGGGPSYRAVFPDVPEHMASCNETGVMGPVVAAIAALQAQMTLSVLIGHQPSPVGQLLHLDLANWRISAMRFDGAPEPATRYPFISPTQIDPADLVIDLRPEAEATQPAHPSARRVAPAELSALSAPAEQRLVLCCRSGLRAMRAARKLTDMGHRSIALLAVGP